MKKLLFCVFALVLTVALVSCGDTATHDTESVTESATETVTETETGTEPVHVHAFGGTNYVLKGGEYYLVCDTCGEASETPIAREDLISTVYEATELWPIEMFGYGFTDNVDMYVPVLTLLKEAGLTGVTSSNQYLSSYELGDLLDACNEVGMGLMIDMHLGGVESEEGRNNVANGAVLKLSVFGDRLSCVRGVYLRDEPVFSMFDSIGVVSKAIQASVSGAEDWVMLINAFPKGVGADDGGYPGFGAYGTGWIRAIEYGIQTMDATAICFDRYPWRTASVSPANSPEYYLANILEARTLSDQYQIPIWGYLQIDSLEGIATLQQYLHNANVGIACGLRSFFNFTSYAAGGFIGMLNGDGTPTAQYTSVKTAVGMINATRGVYRDFSSDCVILTNAVGYETAVEQFNAECYLAESFEGLVSVESVGSILTGCGKDAEGRIGFYVVNLNYDKQGDFENVILHFDGERQYESWSQWDGLIDIDCAEQVSVDVGPGEAAFVIIK